MSAEATRPRLPVAFAECALGIARRRLPRYASRRGSKKFTQHQFFALAALREFLDVDYHVLLAILTDWPELARTLNLDELPHYSTLLRAEKRLVQRWGERTCLIRAA